MPHGLLARFHRDTLQIAANQNIGRILNETSETANGANAEHAKREVATVGNERLLRGIPMTGRDAAGGAIWGTHPEREVLGREDRTTRKKSDPRKLRDAVEHADWDALEAERKRHDDQAHALRSRRRARLANAERGEYKRSEIIARDHSRCHNCQTLLEERDVHLDHLVPLCLGGTDTARNVAVSCKRCNLQRGGRPLRESSIYFDSLPPESRGVS